MLRHACGYKLANDGHDTRALQSLPRAQEHSAYRALHRAGADKVQEFLAGLSEDGEGQLLDYRSGSWAGRVSGTTLASGTVAGSGVKSWKEDLRSAPEVTADLSLMAKTSATPIFRASSTRAP